LDIYSGGTTVNTTADTTGAALAVEARRVVRHFQRYTAEQRANHASAHTLGHQQKESLGEAFYTHPDVPGRSFDTRGSAARAGLSAVTAGAQPSEPEQPSTNAEGQTAHRVSVDEARQHFEQGGTVLVSERGDKETRVVSSSSVTHSAQTTTWTALLEQVSEWRSRYPNQRFYAVPAPALPAEVPADPDATGGDQAQPAPEGCEITITHTHEDGTVLTGSSKGDGVYEIVQAYGWRYSRSVGIYVRGSRDKPAPMIKIRATTAALEEAGHTVTVNVDDTWRTAAEREAARGERVAERVERLEERADKAAGRANAAHEASRSLAERIPLGQPILVGHHSERRARRDVERIQAGAHKSAEESKRAQTLADRAAGAAANEAHKADGPAIMRRIERLETEARDIARKLAGYSREQHNGRGEVIYTDTFPPASGEYAERITARAAVIAEEVGHLRAKLATMGEAGAFVAWGREHFQPGDWAKVSGAWRQVTRVNAKSVSVINRWGWSTSDRAEPVKWDEIHGRRREGLQLDTPNGQAWPVALARRVAQWRELRAAESRATSNRPEYGSDAHAEARNVGYARRIVHGLPLTAAEAEVKAYADTITATDDVRALADASLAIFERLTAGEQVADITASTTPIGTPTWQLPTDREPVDRRACEVLPGELVAGIWDNGYNGRTLLRNFAGPVAAVSAIRDRNEAGEWVTVRLVGGDERTLKARSSWLAVYPPAGGVVEPDPAPVVSPWAAYAVQGSA
jgi:hypothetical protein